MAGRVSFFQIYYLGLSCILILFRGCITPSEVAQAVKRGLKVVKFFPAGGISMIKAMAAPYVGLKFMPTGGINAKNELIKMFEPG